MSEPKPIVIADWQKAIGQSRYTGFEDMRFVDIDEYGVLKINKKLTAMTENSGAIASLAYWIDWGRISSSNARMFAVLNGSYAYYHTGENGWTNIAASQLSNGEGMACWSGSNTDKSYMLIRDDTDLHALDCSSYASPSFDYDITTTLKDVAWGPVFVASNNRVYIGNGNYVAELYENDGETFDPGTGATFTLTEEALDLPSDVVVKCFEELNGDLLIGTYSSIRNDYAEIFVWDKSSSSFDRTIRINNVDGINMLLTYKNLTYIQAGNKGEWFVTNGGSVEKIAELPVGLIEDNEYLTFNPAARTIVGNKLLFGISSGTSGLGLSGVWSIDLRRIDPANIQKAKFDYMISTGETGVNDIVNIGAIIPTQNQGFIVSWQDDENSSYGIDALDVTQHLLSSGAYVTTQYMLVGSHFYKRTLKNIEIMLAKSLASGESVTVYYREERDGSWTTLMTLSTAGKISEVASKILSDLKGVQFKIALGTGASKTSGPEVLSLTAYPAN